MKNRKKQAQEMARYAYRKVPLYYRIAERESLKVEDLEFDEFPLVSKADYVESGMSCLSSEYIGDYMGGKLKMTRTSGSTGKFVEVYWNKEDDIRSLFSLWLYRRKYYGITTTDKLCYFFPSDVGDEDYFEGNHFLGLSKKYIYNGKLKSAYERILEYNPIWMILQPSMAGLLCNIAEQSKEVPVSLRYIEFTGEYLEPTLREKVEKIFRCKTANQYGTKEVNSIAYECPEGKMHCMTDSVYLEVYKDSESQERMQSDIGMIGGQDVAMIEEGEFCVTSLRNCAMPLVRFRLEDRGKIYRNVKCSCGNTSNVLELLEGRKNDWVQMPDGKKVHSYALMQIIHRINYQMDGCIIQYQIVQEDYGRFLVMLVMEEEDFFAEVSDAIVEGFYKRLGEEVEVEVRLFEELLPLERTGKLACFVSRV